MLKIKKSHYQNKLYKAEMAGAPPPWTLKQLIDSIAVDIAVASPARTPLPPARLQEVAAAGAPQPFAFGPSYKCNNCGAQAQHLSKDCPVTCSDCGFNFCPGARGMVCAVCFNDPPSKRGLKNFNGAPMLEFLVAKLDKAWSQRHKKEVSACEVVLSPDESPIVLSGFISPHQLAHDDD